MASKRWEDGEEDSELFKEISRLFEMNRIRGVMDKELSDLLKIQWKSMVDELATSDEEKAAMEKAVKELEDMMREEWAKCQRKVPGLKVLSAIAICKKFKDSEEILNLVAQGHDMEWSDGCMELIMDRMMVDKNTSVRCGFCRFAKWIKEQELPKELKGYCKNVLNYLGQYNKEFYGNNDDENED